MFSLSVIVTKIPLGKVHGIVKCHTETVASSYLATVLGMNASGKSCDCISSKFYPEVLRKYYYLCQQNWVTMSRLLTCFRQHLTNYYRLSLSDE